MSNISSPNQVPEGLIYYPLIITSLKKDVIAFRTEQEIGKLAKLIEQSRRQRIRLVLHLDSEDQTRSTDGVRREILSIISAGLKERGLLDNGRGIALMDHNCYGAGSIGKLYEAHLAGGQERDTVNTPCSIKRFTDSASFELKNHITPDFCKATASAPNLVSIAGTLYDYEDSKRFDFLDPRREGAISLAQYLEHWKGYLSGIDFRYPPADFINFIKTVLIKYLNGLGAIHKAGYVYRDTKPDNIIVIPQSGSLNSFGNLAEVSSNAGYDNVQLTDFDLVHPDPVPESDSLKGTVLYMSPEQVNGSVLHNLSDICSAGMLLYDLFGGMPDMHNIVFTHVRHLIRGGIGDHLSGFSAPLVVQDIVNKCTQRQPSKRFQDTQSLISAIQQI